MSAHVVAELRAIVHAEPWRYGATERQNARDALAAIARGNAEDANR